MTKSQVLSELENKNEEICLFIKKNLSTSDLKLNNAFFDLLTKKLQNHDKILINALDDISKNIEKITMTLAKHIK